MKKVTEKTKSRYASHTIPEQGNEFEQLRNRIKQRYPGLEEHVKRVAENAQLCGFCLSGMPLVLGSPKAAAGIAPVL